MLKSVKDACVLRPNALDIRVSDQVERLDQLISEGDGKDFFSKTYLTEGMSQLIREGTARLAGKSRNAIFHLKQAMGGGKTHLMVGFGLLSLNPDLRKVVVPDIPHGTGFEKAKVAAFNGRHRPSSFFWGEIANQIDKGELFRDYWSGGPKAPDEGAWLELFSGEDPILILLDELPPYFHYYNTQQSGNGTIADIVTDAFANLLTAASKKSRVCIVVSDLSAAYDTGTQLIQRALENARQELGRQEYTITPVDLTGNEVYEILRKHLFESLPDQSVIDDVSTYYGQALSDAEKSKSVRRGAESIADEIAGTYPFHPQLKHLVALFKENEKFRQTRGLMELASRLLKSVWDCPTNDIFLIGPQHFDLSNNEVRNKLAEISGMQDVISKDLWDHNQSAHAQVISLTTQNDSATQVGTLLLTASLSTAHNSVKGLTKEEMLECLIDPFRKPSDFLTAFEVFESSAWYLHHTPEGRYYFDRQENLTKLLQSLAEDAPENQVDGLIRHRLTEMFQTNRKVAYSKVLPLPKMDEAAGEVRKGRVLLIVSPDSKIPPEEVRRFFESLTEKNNVLVLTGDKSQMGSVEKAARQVYAAQKANDRIAKGHLQREELEHKQQQYEQGFLATILSLFDKILYPRQMPGQPALLVPKPLDLSRDPNKPFNGEEQVEKTLTSDPLKLYVDVDKNFEGIREKAEILLWPESTDEVRWEDFLDRAKEQAGMPWLPDGGLKKLRDLAVSRGVWEDLGNGYITKKPRKKKTSVQPQLILGPDDRGRVTLRINPQHGGPAPRIHYAEDGPVSESSPLLKEEELTTSALRIQFLVVDPTGQNEMGAPFVWTNSLVIRNELKSEGGRRKLSLHVAPKGSLRYTLDGSEPRNGISYTGPIELGEGAVRILVFAQEDGVEGRADFLFPAVGSKKPLVDPAKPAKLACRAPKRLDSREKTFLFLKEGKERNITFSNINIDIGQGEKVARITLGNFDVGVDYIESFLDPVLKQFDPTVPMTLSFRNATFHSGHDLLEFAKVLDVEPMEGEISQ